MEAKTILDRLAEASRAKIKNYPVNNIRASDVGHPCTRFLVLNITHWPEKKPHDTGLQNIFDLGNAIEAETIRRLKETGLEVLTARRNFKIESPLITGREDIMLQDPENGELWPCEIKGLAPLTWDKINSVSDMLRHKAYYIRKYPAQLQIYCYAHNKEKGCFILFNKINGRIKVIEVPLDYDYVEGLLKKTESVYSHIAAKTLPEAINDENVCEDCPLLHICGAKIDRGETVIDTGELEELLDERERLLPYIKKHRENEAMLKRAARGFDRAFTGSYFVEKAVIRRKPFVVAGSVYTKLKVRRIV